MENPYTKRGNQNRSYMRLDVWLRGMELFDLVWRTVNLAHSIDFKLRGQVTDAAQSVSSNIAEGYSRRSPAEYTQFLYVAFASLSETLTRAIGLRSTAQITAEEFERIDALHYEVENKLIALIKSVKTKRDEDGWNTSLHEEPAHYSTTPSIH